MELSNINITELDRLAYEYYKDFFNIMYNSDQPNITIEKFVIDKKYQVPFYNGSKKMLIRRRCEKIQQIKNNMK